MKTFLIGCSMLLMAGTVAAQEKSIREFKDSFKGKADMTTVHLGSMAMKLAGMVMKMDKDDDPETIAAKKLIDKVKNLRIYSFENLDSTAIAANDVFKLKRNLEVKDHYELLMEVREQNNQIHILNKGKNDELGDLVMLIQGDRELTVINLHTTLKIEDVNGLVKQFASN
ncbi:DUF4252 domain-containing protein [Chitinophaga sp. sic0106]|uniref:DUF4252 domain-containing protein n=1 Tax=Chitinophaga sp. sic0106 TaxID=2854785 RepID=UPI001C444766|nr:DUF4252 domain-containing protein [Chitinophaga sp. sic0106]MBV7529968.1 DUF4252 domain-containing protein [Chitinophaga sp. sic0106]